MERLPGRTRGWRDGHGARYTIQTTIPRPTDRGQARASGNPCFFRAPHFVSFLRLLIRRPLLHVRSPVGCYKDGPRPPWLLPGATHDDLAPARSLAGLFLRGGL